MNNIKDLDFSKNPERRQAVSRFVLEVLDNGSGYYIFVALPHKYIVFVPDIYDLQTLRAFLESDCKGLNLTTLALESIDPEKVLAATAISATLEQLRGQNVSQKEAARNNNPAGTAGKPAAVKVPGKPRSL